MREVIQAGLVIAALAAAARPAPADEMLRDFVYPYLVHEFRLTSQRQPLTMAYMDIPATGPANGQTVVALHGKNFCGATWESVITPLAAAGYRVVVPDQIGFCKSSKPEAYQMSFHQHAANTRALLQSLGIAKPIVMGHSMGGMLAIRYALSFPEDTTAIVLVNPIGLEDWSAKGVPARTVDALYEAERKTTRETIKAYQQKVYYDGQWKPEYDRWVDMLASMYTGPQGDRVAWLQALASDMIFTQPVVHELRRISVPTVLMIGEKDTTAIGRDRAPPEVARLLGDYPRLAREAAESIEAVMFIPFPELGHSPHVESPDTFNTELIEALAPFSGG